MTRKKNFLDFCGAAEADMMMLLFISPSDTTAPRSSHPLPASMGRWGRGKGNLATTPVTDWDGSNDESVHDLKESSRKFSWLSGRGWRVDPGGWREAATRARDHLFLPCFHFFFFHRHTALSPQRVCMPPPRAYPSCRCKGSHLTHALVMLVDVVGP